MNRSIEQALLSLVPALNGSLPDPLVQLASSLVAQSRNRASTLKAEEEVARLYACARQHAIGCSSSHFKEDFFLIKKVTAY